MATTTSETQSVPSTTIPAFVFCPLGVGNAMMPLCAWQMSVYAAAYQQAWERTEAKKRSAEQAQRASRRVGSEIVFSLGQRD